MLECVDVVPVSPPIVAESVKEVVVILDENRGDYVGKDTMIGDCMLLMNFPCTAFIYEMRTQDGLCGSMRDSCIKNASYKSLAENCECCDPVTEMCCPCIILCHLLTNCLKTSKYLAGADNSDYCTCFQYVYPILSFNLAFFICTPCLFCIPITGNLLFPNFISKQTNYIKN